MNDAEGERAHAFTIVTRAKCAQDGHAINSAYLLEIERHDGETFSFCIESAARIVDLYRNLAPCLFDVFAADGEDCPLPYLLGEGAARLH